MSRKYDIKLLNLLKERTIEDTYMGAPLTIKRLPDSDEAGAMDLRLYNDMKSQLNLLKFIPSKMMKMDTSEKGIEKLRETFNGIKSTPTCTMDIQRHHILVPMDDGYQLDLYQYTQENTKKEQPVLFYIHGGGFFGGHHGVVEESLKVMCEKYAFTIFSLDYRLAPENPYPRGHYDCYQTLKWVYEHSEELNIDKDHIFVAGDSAGGNLTQYCSTRDYEEGGHIVKGQMLLYPTLNMCGIEDEYFHWSIDQYETTKKQGKALKKMISMMDGMTSAMEDILKTKDVNNDYLNPYTRDPHLNPPTFITVGEHDSLKIESLGYGAKLYAAGIDVKMVLYKGFGHAFFDNCGVYPQCEDCIDEMAQFMIEHC